MLKCIFRTSKYLEQNSKSSKFNYFFTSNLKYVYYTNAIYTNVPKLTDNLLDLCGFLKIETSTKYL